MSANTEKLNEEIKRLGQTTGLFADVVQRLDGISQQQKRVADIVDGNVDNLKKIAEESLKNTLSIDELITEFNEEKRDLQTKIKSLENRTDMMAVTIGTMANSIEKQNSRNTFILLICLVQTLLLLFLVFHKS